ncbi:nucleolar protein dao-5-like [Branchiostoma lanceolatum]|uniref:nucleolar protein dao-5-like n=1 Tax=Branchiostoma lanceolatum TaxID=7740 RepID=UPI0034532A8E
MDSDVSFVSSWVRWLFSTVTSTSIVNKMFGVLLQFFEIIFRFVMKVVVFVAKALKAPFGRQTCEASASEKKPPTVPLHRKPPEAVKINARRSDLNGRKGTNVKANVPLSPSTGEANNTKKAGSKASFAGLKPCFLLTRKKAAPAEGDKKCATSTKQKDTAECEAGKCSTSQKQKGTSKTDNNATTPQKQGAAQADNNNATTPQKQGAAEADNNSTTPQKQGAAETDKATTSPKQGAAEADEKSTASPRGQPEEDTPRPSIPICPVLAQVRPVVLPIPGTNYFAPVWDGSEKAQIMLQMIMAARRQAGLY